MIQELRKELPILMRHSAGICGTQKALDDAIARFEIGREQLATLPLSQNYAEFTAGQNS